MISTTDATSTPSTIGDSRDAARPWLSELVVRPMLEADVAPADRVLRLAFGTYLGLADPASFKGDAGYVRTRWRADPSAAFVAELRGEIVGSNFATSWGRMGFPGPMTVRPDLWDRGVGSRLMDAVTDRFVRWQTEHVVCFTYADSVRRVSWYQRLGFWPRFLTAIMSRPVQPRDTDADARLTTLSQLAEADRPAAIAACREVTDSIFPGMDVTYEIQAIATQQLGDTVLLWDGDRLEGLAVCHYGPGTEAGTGTCYLKCAAVRTGAGASRHFDRLLHACNALGARVGASRLLAGVNTARIEAYQMMLASGFRIDLLGISMQIGDLQGSDRPGLYALDDWR